MIQDKIDIIIIRGAPGSGKSQTAKELAKFYPNGARIEVDTIRNMIISVNWKNQQEHIDMLHASTKLIVEFLEFGYSPVIVVDTFSGDKINKFLETLYSLNENLNIKIIGLLVNEAELKVRLQQRKNDEFKDFVISKKLNEDVLKWKNIDEIQIDTTNLTANETATKIFGTINYKIF